MRLKAVDGQGAGVSLAIAGVMREPGERREGESSRDWVLYPLAMQHWEAEQIPTASSRERSAHHHSTRSIHLVACYKCRAPYATRNGNLPWRCLLECSSSASQPMNRYRLTPCLPLGLKCRTLIISDDRLQFPRERTVLNSNGNPLSNATIHTPGVWCPATESCWRVKNLRDL